jgi:hypothetical protein
MAEVAPGLEKQVMLDRAEENLSLSLEIRKKVLEPTHPDVALTMQALATVMPSASFKCMNARMGFN